MVTLHVEGGGDSRQLKIECRKGFTTFLAGAGLKRRPRVVACGSRGNAYDAFRTAIGNGKAALLLVDSEEPVAAAHRTGRPEDWQPWEHLGARKDDRWKRPDNGKDIDCHLMVQVMESWFLTDRRALKSFFGPGFRENRLPSAARPVEEMAKPDVYRALKEATADCKTKGPYGKGEHSFKLLAEIDPVNVTTASPWAKRLVDTLEKVMDA